MGLSREISVTTAEAAFNAVPETFYTHNDQRGETLHRSARESIRREVTALRVPAGARVLEVGTGSGYSGAVLAALAGPDGRVTSVDISEHLTGWANLLHRRRGATTVTCHTGDGAGGFPSQAPYDRVVAWCTFERLPQAWVEQVAPRGRIVACLPIAAQPSATLITTVTVEAGRPLVEEVTFGGYAQSTPAAVEDALTVPGRWVDWSTRGPAPSWISIGWRARDDRLRTGARTLLDRLLSPGHTETYGGESLDWPSWNVYSAVAGGPQRTVVSLHARARGIGRSGTGSAAVIFVDGTIIADRPGSPSLGVLKRWLDDWERAGRPGASRYVGDLRPYEGTGRPGWDLRARLRPAGR
ncbi:hypothetical protein Aab01nite_61070 [Paractinoplanes abujensis]|uniref:Protein-L-isoaspartate O-methyltransferase n=1 Tax=Paractinoplanes abujensis TaxID=882441 RepID=A0A7W7G1T9_9ACTN|nr:methyltransferase domain-containing protein [Actinoplanes abujensis]MBB4692979.1 protein-L-isoaspartate(D-aspartate) O-methyltransferase [Actinoplanes abujensis]GID22517.1 hypothetical protein Aab01nite_61070 [Actinoplanes abujensis]